MGTLIISEEERQVILAKHNLAKMIFESKLQTVSDLQKEIEELEKKIEELKNKSKKTETKEDEFDDLVNADIEDEEERDSLEQS